MSTEDIIYLAIGLGLILGAFVTAWIFFRVLGDIDKNSKASKIKKQE